MAAKSERWVADFETEAIRTRPSYPPKPVGVALGRLRDDGTLEKTSYTGWAHASGKNSTQRQVEKCGAEMKRIWSECEVVFHNGKFDVDVAETHLELKAPPALKVHDTMFMAYLEDPRAKSLALKPNAQRLLGMEPEERDAVRDWLVDNRIVKSNDSDWGAAISLAPMSVVGPYALGDIERTGKLYAFLRPLLEKRGMWKAYEREQRLVPMLLDNERRGARVDLPRLMRDVAEYTKEFERCETWIRRKLNAPDLDLDKDVQLADALDRAGLVENWVLTKTGKRSTSKKNMTVSDGPLKNMLDYRAQLATCLRTFLGPWLEQARQTGGYIHTNWNQTRGDNDKGTRTGRISSNPNKQNIPLEFKPLKLPIKLRALPLCRGYIIADEGDVLLSADYSQQELRALGHFEDGPLLAAYKANPRMDIHDFAQKMVNQLLGTNFPRKPIKNMGFGLIYGMGIALLAVMMDVDEDTAKTIKKAYLRIFPGMKDLIDDLYKRARMGLPIKTWGGREYYCEKPAMVDGRLRTFEYKMLNLLIQGSCADATKEAMVRLWESGQRQSRFLFQIHDQLLNSAPKSRLKQEAILLRNVMESLEFDVPMLVDLSSGPDWSQLVDLEV